MPDRIVILGAGFGGLATATELRDRLPPEDEIVIVDRGSSFYMGLRKLWLLVGSGTLDGGSRELDTLEERGIDVRRAEITRIDSAARRVETTDGPIDGDFLVVALGAEPAPERVQGLAEHAFNLYDAASVAAAAPRIAALEAGHVVVAIAGLPYKCPPAPYEATMLLDDAFRRRGVRDRVRLSFTTLQPMLLPNAGPEGARWMAEQLDERGIEHHVGRKVDRIEERRIVFEDGEMEFDIAIVAPPHRAPDVVLESGLTGGGEWITADPGTFATGFERVFAIGDVTHVPLANKMPLPKAGVMAEAQGRRVAAAIAAELAGESAPPPYDGRGFCYVEMGSVGAAAIEGDFYATPAPDLRLSEPSSAGLEAKHRFEAERLARWFGS
jgi:sulfide:quinone oxidoreductase